MGVDVVGDEGSLPVNAKKSSMFSDIQPVPSAATRSSWYNMRLVGPLLRCPHLLTEAPHPWSSLPLDSCTAVCFFP